MGSTARSGSAGVLGLAVAALAVAAAVLAALAAALAVWFAVRHPFFVAFAVGSAIAMSGYGPIAVVGLWAAIGVGVAVWRAHGRASFDRRVLSRWRRTFVYGWRWRRVMVGCDLDRFDHRFGRVRRAVPRLGNVRSSRWIDTVTVHPLDGQTAATFAARARGLAQGFRALRCAVRADAAGVVRIELRRGDPLTTAVAALPIAEHPDLDALPLGVREDGAPWTVQLGHGHLLITGGSGSGKGSVLWSLVRALAVPVREGSVELWGIDGSGGFGLGAGEDMFARLALGGPADGVGVLEDAAALLRARAGRRRAGAGRAAGDATAAATASDCIVVLVLDEVVRWGPALDDRVRRRLAAALEVLLAHGRLAGVVVVATAPAAEPALARLFPQRVTLQPAGAPRPSLPGVGYASAGRDDPVRVRAAYMSEDEVAAMADRFRCRARRGSVPRPRVSLEA
ncbi:MAG TPA: FtsK/SpoIIIE domain-containing protein [Acidimicrobiales bacterium]